MNVQAQAYSTLLRQPRRCPLEESPQTTNWDGSQWDLERPFLFTLRHPVTSQLQPVWLARPSGRLSEAGLLYRRTCAIEKKCAYLLQLLHCLGTHAVFASFVQTVWIFHDNIMVSLYNSKPTTVYILKNSMYPKPVHMWLLVQWRLVQ